MVMIPMTGEAYTSVAPQYSAQTCINWYRSIMTPSSTLGYTLRGIGTETKYTSAYYPTPGLVPFVNLNGGTVRAMLSTDGTLYAVCDNTFYAISTAGTITPIATLNTSTGACSMISNLQSQIMISDGKNGYVYTVATNTFEVLPINQGGFPAGYGRLGFQDGYAFFPIPGTTSFQASNLNDFTNYSALAQTSLNTTTINNLPVAAETSHLQLFLFGEKQTEVWYNAGNINTFPFSRLASVLLEYGCAAPLSIINVNQSLMWISKSATGQFIIGNLNNYNMDIISTEFIQRELATYPTVSDAIGMSYTLNNHIMSVWTFPSADKTWVYDNTTQLFHQWSSWDNKNQKHRRHLANCIVQWNNKNYVGDYSSGNIYTMDNYTYTDNGLPIVRERTFPTVQNNPYKNTINMFQLDLERGVGLPTGQGSSPRIMFSVSRNSGLSFEAERLMDMGEMGSAQQKCRIYRLGQMYDFTARIRCSDPVFAAPFAAFIDVEQDDF